MLALAGVDGTPPPFIYDQGSALLTPLVHNALLSREVEAARAIRPVNSIIFHRKQRQQYLESLYALIFTINSATDLDDILRTGLDEALQITETARGSIYLPNRGGTFTLRVFQGFDADDVDDAGITPQGLTRAATEKRMIIERHPSPVGPHTEIYLPLIVEDQIVGLMNLIALQDHDITPEAAQLLVAIADQLALAVQRGQLTDKMRDQLQTVQYLYEVSTAFLSQMVTSDIIFLLLRALTDTVVGTIGAAFYQFEGETWTRARVYATRNPEVRMHWKEGEPWDGEIEFLTMCQQERMLVITGSNRHIAASFWGHVEAVGAKQLLYLPLFSPNHNFSGAVIVLMDEERTLTANESILAWAIIQQGTAAMVRVGLYESSRQSESLMRAILESSRDGIILVGPDMPESHIRYINGKALQMLAIQGGATVWEGQTLSQVIAAIRANTSQIAEWLQDIVGQETPREVDDDKEKAPVFKTDQGLMLQIQHWPVYSEKNQPLGALFLFRDVTEEKALERMRDDLLNMLVHDMRSPLSATQYSLHLLQDPAMQDVKDKIIRIAITGTERLTNLVDTILQIGRLESGRFELHQKALILADQVAEVSKNALVSAENLRFEMDVPYELSFLWADPSVVTRVFENLLTNALKFVPKDSGFIRISATQVDKWIETEIYNNGPHIPPETQKQLFEKFAAGQYKKRGFGLGLAFCRLAVEAHGGNIWAQNQPDGGVSFYFTLPVWDEPDIADDFYS